MERVPSYGEGGYTRIPPLPPELFDMIDMNKFGGTPDESPHDHLANFEDILAMFSFHPNDLNAIRMRIFRYTLTGTADQWYRSLDFHNVTTWEDLVLEFFDEYSPQQEFSELQKRIEYFRQEPDEPLYTAWARFQEMIRHCPDHNFENSELIIYFYEGARDDTKFQLDAGASGDLLDLDEISCWKTINRLARKDEQNSAHKKSQATRSHHVATLEEVEEETMDETDLTYAIFATSHSPGPIYTEQELPPTQQAPMPLFSNLIQGIDQTNPPGQEEMYVLEETFPDHPRRTYDHSTEPEISREEMRDIMKEFNQNFERMFAILSRQEASSLPSDSEEIPKEQISAITLQEGIEIEGAECEKEEAPLSQLVEVATKATEEEDEDLHPEDEGIVEKELIKKEDVAPIPPPEKVKIPLPKARKRKAEDNVPLVDTILQTPHYTKMFKTILGNGHKWEDMGKVCLAEAYIATILNNASPKRVKDPGIRMDTGTEKADAHQYEYTSTDALKPLFVSTIMTPEETKEKDHRTRLFNDKRKDPNFRTRSAGRRRRRSSSYKGHKEGKCRHHAPTSQVIH